MSTNTSSGNPPAGGPDATTTDPAGDPDDSQKWFAKANKVTPAAETMSRFRYAVAPERWYEVALSLGVLYGGFIGVPAAAGVWSAVTIWHRMHHGG